MRILIERSSMDRPFADRKALQAVTRENAAASHRLTASAQGSGGVRSPMAGANERGGGANRKAAARAFPHSSSFKPTSGAAIIISFR